MKTLITFLALLSFQIMSAQDISGTISDNQGQGIFFVTVALYNAVDSTIVLAESTDDEGQFSLPNLKEGSYYITASMLGYADKSSSIFEIPYSTPPTLDLILDSDSQLLSTVEIVDKAPLMEQKADKLIVNVDGNITNTGGNLLDVMKKVPGMIVIRDRLNLAGSGSPTILLNGKSTQYMDIQSLLRDMPGDNIKKVEIIHQPGAEYEASGKGPIINIILKKNSLFGTNGSVSVGVGKGNRLWDYNTGLQLSHYAGNLNISGGIGYARNAWVEELEITRNLTNIADQVDGQYSQLNVELATPDTYRGNIRLDWDVTDRHRLGWSSKVYVNENQYQANNGTQVDLFKSTAQDYALNSVNDIDRSWQYYSLNPYYIFEIDTSGQKLELDFSNARYQTQSYNTLTTTNNLDTTSLGQRYDQPGDTKITAVTLDYSKPLNKVFDLKTGVKYSQANLDNNLQAENRTNISWFSNPQQSNHYLFDERIAAAYGKISWITGKWSGTAGLRYEDSHSVGNSLTIDSIQVRNIKRLFPSFSLSRELGGPLKSTISYSRRIERPRYSSLNPFVFYIDPFTSQRGNPNLRPQLTHSAKFTLSYEGQPFFNIEYKRSSDAIVEVTEQERTNEEAFKIDVNFELQEQFSTSLFFPLDFIPGISGYSGVIMSRNSYDSNYIGDQFLESRWNATAFLQAEFELPGDIQGELGGWYTSGAQEGIFQSEYLYGSSFGLSKKFLDRKMKVSLGVEDFVNRFWHANVDFQQDLDLVVRWQAPTVSAKVSYKFGNQHLKSKKKTAGSASEELRRAQQ